MGEIIADMDAKGIFAKNLKAAMAYRGVSAGEIHRKTGQWADPGVAQSTVGRIVAGKQAPDLDTISLICRALDYRPWQMLVQTFDPANPPFIPKLTKEEAALYDRLRSILNGQK